MANSIGDDFVPTTRHDTYPAIDPAKADFSGKVVLIAGASRGIGKTTALAIAQAGARGLALFARSDLTEVKAACLSVQQSGHPLEVLTLPVDITQNDQVVAAVKKVEETFGRLDIVINNAGYVENYTPIADSDPADWWRSWDINLRGTYHVVRATIPLLIQSGGDKTIVNVTSAMANAIFPGFSSYCSSKFALLRFTEFIDAEYSDKGVLAYSIHPGVIETELSLNVTPDEYKHMLIDTLELPAHTILWLLKERRDWLAARYISCNWDMEELLAKKDEIVEGNKLKPKLIV